MSKDVFVISDIHAGGKPGFQMLSPRGVELLADFSSWIADRQVEDKTPDVHLVINGDIVDFLAEEEWAAFSAEDSAATKFARIIANTSCVWRQWRRLVEHGGQITILLGNHDIELCYAKVERLLRDSLGDGRVDVLFDGRALVIEDILIEHGNRYDVWNRIQYDDLRAIRSASSRRESRMPDLAIQPGSELVVRLVNEIKGHVEFVDLLKPEQEGLLPLLKALAPGRFRKMCTFLGQYRRTWFARTDEAGRPKNPGYIAGEVPPPEEKLVSPAMWDRLMGGADEIAADDDDTWLTRWNDLSPKRRAKHLAEICEALCMNRTALVDAYRTDYEIDEYWLPAKASIDLRFKLVVYGHTHLVRRKKVHAGMYLNTGTWADLVRFPDVVFGDDKNAAHAKLGEMVDDIVAKRSTQWRFQYPTFVWIPCGDPTKADVYHYRGKGDHVVVPDGVRPVLTGRTA